MGKNKNPISLAEALVNCVKEVGFCPQCGFFSEHEIHCQICRDEQRSQHEICVVERASDILSLERSEAFRGFYHCLGGLLSPLDGVHPEDLKIEGLVARVQKLNAEEGEVILALGANVEGEATSSYIEEILSPHGIKVTRLARGIPVGANLEFTDQLTLARAFEGRKT